MARAALLLVPVLLLAGCSADPPHAPPAPTPGGALVRLEPLLEGLSSPVLAVDDPATQGEMYVAEQGGRVWRVAEGVRDPAPFLDVSELTSAGGERGLLGLAFALEARADGRRPLYVSYTDLRGDSVLARYHVKDGVVQEGAEALLKVEQPYSNHNGGHVVLHQGHLYYGLGDGGGANDPQGNGQDPHALLGSLLRLDVAPETGYAIPPDNPYADGKGGAPEVYAKGLRNPWRFSFDRVTGDLWIADVGQNAIEEVNHVPAGAARGANFGWSVYEGTRHRLTLDSTFSPATPPVAEYGHEEGCSVTGGFLYRGPAIEGLRGAYVFSDYCSGTLWALRREANDAWRRETLLETGLRVSSFGEDERGELWVVDHHGSVHRLVAAG